VNRFHHHHAKRYKLVKRHGWYQWDVHDDCRVSVELNVAQREMVVEPSVLRRDPKSKAEGREGSEIVNAEAFPAAPAGSSKVEEPAGTLKIRA